MTPIVKNITRVVIGFIAVFGIYIALTGHVSPGGGFAGGVILAAAGALMVLAFGRDAVAKTFTLPQCRFVQACGALLFLLVAVFGYTQGAFFVNFVPKAAHGEGSNFLGSGTILLSDLFILINVSAGVVGAFLAIATFGRANGPLDRLEVGD
jgi:multicomponent Na+:H+ antiporter subunit B